MPKYTTQYGLCFSYLVPKYLKEAEIRDISLYVKKNVDVYLSHPGQFLSWQAHSFPMRLGQVVYVETSHEVITIRCINSVHLVLTLKLSWNQNVCTFI